MTKIEPWDCRLGSLGPSGKNDIEIVKAPHPLPGLHYNWIVFQHLERHGLFRKFKMSFPDNGKSNGPFFTPQNLLSPTLFLKNDNFFEPESFSIFMASFRE